jgi:hypothetical protein
VNNLNYTPTILRAQSWREITSGGTRTKRIEYQWEAFKIPCRKNHCLAGGRGGLFALSSDCLIKESPANLRQKKRRKIWILLACGTWCNRSSLLPGTWAGCVPTEPSWLPHTDRIPFKPGKQKGQRGDVCCGGYLLLHTVSVADTLT